MRTITKKIALTVFAAAAVSVPNISRAAEDGDKHIQAVVGATPSVIVQTGTRVTLSATPNQLLKVPNAQFRWLKDEVEISEQTDSTYTISSAALSDAAEYTVVVYKTGISAEAAPLFLSVYQPVTNSNGGVMATPVGDFSSGSGYTLSCGTGTFDRYKTYFPFDGPNMSPASPTYPNTSNSTNLNVTTCTNLNGTLDTGIKIQDNWGTLTQRACADNNCGLANTNLSSATCPGLVTGKTSRVTIYYKSATVGTNTTVTFKWLYYN